MVIGFQKIWKVHCLRAANSLNLATGISVFARSIRVTIAASLVDSLESISLELLRAKRVLKLSPGGF